VREERTKTNMSENTQVVKVERSNSAIGARGIELRNMDELVRFAGAVVKSGLAPKGIDTDAAIAVAIQMGLEVGLSPMAALQNIAVINGRPSIWGDAQLAVCRATGELEAFEEWYESGGNKAARNPQNFGDDASAVCRVKRRGYPAVEQVFSVADAKRAGLWGKQGPWTQYPARMLRFRARSFALRDQFSDALKGLMSAEEVQDIPADPVEKAKNVTPTRVVVSDPVPAKPADDLDMTPPRRITQSEETPAQTTFPVSEATPGNPARTLEKMIADNGATFDHFVAVLRDMNQILKDAEPGGIDELPAALITAWVSKPKPLASALKVAKGVVR